MRRRSGSVAVVLAIALMGIAWAAVPAFAKDGWVPAESVAAPKQASNAKVAMDDQSNAIAVWNDDGEILLAKHPANGDWGAPETLSSEAESHSPALAVNGSGEAVIAWLVGYGEDAEVVTVEIGADGTLSAPLSLPAMNVTDGDGALAVAIDEKGGAAIMWGTEEGTRFALHAAGKQFNAIYVFLGSVAASQGTSVAIEAGRAHFFWIEDEAGHAVVKTASILLTLGGPQDPQVISAPDESAFELRAAMNAHGDAVVAWGVSSWEDEELQTRIKATARSAGSAWSPVTTLSANTAEAIEPAVGIDGEGEALVVWAERQDDGAISVATWREAVGFADPFAFSTGSSPASPAVAINADGASLVAWRQGMGTEMNVRAALKDADAGLFTTTQLSTGGPVYPPAAAIDADGNAVVTWPQRIGATASDVGALAVPKLASIGMMAAGYDVGPARIADLQVPAKAVAGQPVAISVTTWDVWDHAPSIEIDLGDGASATGASASHVYAKPGTYEVRAVATNTTGEPSAPVSATIEVTPAPATPPVADRPVEAPRVLLGLLSAPKVKIVKGKALLTVVNKGNRAVAGTLRLWTAARLWRSGTSGVGEAKFRLAVGQKKAIRVPIDKAALKQIRKKRNGRLAVKATAFYADASAKVDKPSKASRKVVLLGR